MFIFYGSVRGAPAVSPFIQVLRITGPDEGTVDPQTGDIVPKAKDGGRNRSALVVEDLDDSAGIIELRRKLEERSEEVARLKAAVARLRAEEVRLSARVRELEELNEDLLATFVAMDDMLKGVRERMPGS